MKKYICVFCDERKTADTADIISGSVGICRSCADKLPRTAPSLPYKGTNNVSYIMSPFEYTGIIQQPIRDLKFNNCRAYAPLFSSMMENYLLSYNIWDNFDYIIPIPLNKIRLRERTYNQSELIARGICEYINLPCLTEGVERVRATKKQSTLTGADRMSNVKGAFAATMDFSGKNILLFDDICTSGNTLDACASALKDAGAEQICALTFAIYVEHKKPILMY